jgi:hypothetical protein
MTELEMVIAIVAGVLGPVTPFLLSFRTRLIKISEDVERQSIAIAVHEARLGAVEGNRTQCRQEHAGRSKKHSEEIKALSDKVIKLEAKS